VSADAVTRQGIRPLFDWIVVKELDPDKVRRSGVLLPDTYSEKDGPPHHAIVVAVGGGLDWWSGAGIEMPVTPGRPRRVPARGRDLRRARRGDASSR
jgi:hypothetical protein